ncbi:MAG: metallophosphoesterase [Luteolibacter sp.]
MSDLHAEHFPEKEMASRLAVVAEEIRSGNPDLIILAGDIHQRKRGVEWVAEMLNPQQTGVPVVIIAGNHEFYSRDRYDKVIRQCRATAAQYEGIHFLDATGPIEGIRGVITVEAAGLRITGTTLWTDARFGVRNQVDEVTVMMDLQAKMNDFKKIHFRDGTTFRKWKVNDMRKQHVREVEALLAGGQSDIIVTHHLPHPKGISPEHTSSDVNAAYLTDLTEVIHRINAPLWIHGHSHGARNYQVGATRIVNVSRGYPGEETSRFTEIVFEPGRGVVSVEHFR